MKILCETQVLNRQTQVNRTPRPVKTTMALGFSTIAKTRDNEGESKKALEIILFTPQQKLGTRYKVGDNIEKMFTKFVQDGKVTISFRQPPENVMIKCDPIQLKAFLRTLKLGVEGKETANLRMNIATATAIAQKSIPKQKMTILKRGDYPSKGFPKTLEHLTVSGIQLHKITFDICSLRHLTTLDLSYNNITKIPTGLGRLSLTTFHMNNNQIGELNSWDWLEGKQLQKTLRDLDLSVNNLNYFPPLLVKCEQLVTLKLNNNTIRRIPFGVRRMHSLRYLHMASNKLASLPSSFNHMRLEVLDVWGNTFDQQARQAAAQNVPALPARAGTQEGTANGASVTPLWLLAARAVCQHKLPYSAATLPWLLVDILSESPRCACGKLCYAPDSVLNCAALATFNNVKSLVYSRDRLTYADIVLCGPSCMGHKQLLLAEH